MSLDSLQKLWGDLKAHQEQAELAKNALRKELKDLKADGKWRKERAGPLMRKVESEVAQSRVLQVTLGVGEIKLPDMEKFRYKKNYENFKITSTIVVTFMTLANLVFIKSKITDTIQILAHMYIYCTLTIREHILINNGSNIKPWWILHHYTCIALTGMVLTCPEEAFQNIRDVILRFTFLLSSSQVLQYQYQIKRLYIMRALKQADPLETTSDVMSLSLSTNLGITAAFLLMFQFFQLYVAYQMYCICLEGRQKHVQPLIGSGLICVMALGNLTTILYTCYKKCVKGKRKKKSPELTEKGNEMNATGKRKAQ